MHDYDRDLSSCFRIIEDTVVLGNLIHCCIDSHDRAPFLLFSNLVRAVCFYYLCKTRRILVYANLNHFTMKNV